MIQLTFIKNALFNMYETSIIILHQRFRYIFVSKNAYILLNAFNTIHAFAKVVSYKYSDSWKAFGIFRSKYCEGANMIQCLAFILYLFVVLWHISLPCSHGLYGLMLYNIIKGFIAIKVEEKNKTIFNYLVLLWTTLKVIIYND